MAEPEEESEILVTVPVVYMAAVEHHTLAEMVDMVMVVKEQLELFLVLVEHFLLQMLVMLVMLMLKL
jgi:hypothetical protein